MNDLPPLSPEELALVRAEQDNVRAPPAAKERVLARIVPILPPSPPHDAPAASTAAHAVARASAIKLVVALAVGGAAGAGTHAALTTPETRVVYVDRPAPAPAPVAPPPVAPSAMPAPAPTPEAPPPSSRAAAPVASLDRASRLAAERALLDTAHSAIVAGRPADALTSLDAHAARFPHGDLEEEREALAIKALAKMGRAGAARTRAAEFHQRFPQSLFTDGVESDLRQNP
jgi:hypothetical protein